MYIYYAIPNIYFSNIELFEAVQVNVAIKVITCFGPSSTT